MAVQSFVRWNMDRLAVRWLAPTTKTTWRAGGTPAKQDSPLCILPGPHGSFGDEAMAAGIVELLGEDSVQFVAQGDGADWPTPGGVESFNGLHHRFLPFVSAQGRLQAARRGALVIGADTISGAYEHSFLAWRVALLNHAVNAL